MFSRTKTLAASLALGAAVMFTPVLPAAAQPQTGLVNVAIDDVEVLKNVNVAAVVPVVVQACPNVNVQAVVAALAVVTDNDPTTPTTQTVDCEVGDQDVVISQAAAPEERGGRPAGR